MRNYRMFIRILLGITISYGQVGELNYAWAAEEHATIERASGDDLAIAVAHYARARSLLVAAIREFDSGRKSADPGALIDAQAWRDVLVARAQDLEKVLDPQPRASKAGVVTNADPRLLGIENKSDTSE